MKKITKILTVFMAISLLIISNSCSNGLASEEKMVAGMDMTSKEVKEKSKKNSGLSKKELIKKMIEALDEVHSTEVKYHINIDKGQEDDEKETFEYALLTDIIYSDTGSMDRVYNKLEVDGRVQNETYANITNTIAYVREGDEEKFKKYEVTEDSDMQVQDDSEYKKTVKMLEVALPHMELEEDGLYYYVTFKGRSGDVFFALDGLFNMGLDIQALDLADIDMYYKIRKADFALIEVIHKADQIYENEKYHHEGKMTLEKLNAFDKLKVEEKLFENSEEDKKTA